MQALNMILYTGITLGVLVFVHELGHFLAAKLAGMRVDRFSIGFPPRAFGKQIGDTDYCVSWIPIGGYVKIAGMIDESFDTDFLQRTPEPWEFRARPLWARMLVISAGVMMNVLLAICIFWGINYTHGRLIEETTEVGYVAVGSPAEKAGFHAGDKILSVNGKQVMHWDEVLNTIYVENFGKDISFVVERKAEHKELSLSRKEFPDNSQQPLGIVEAHTVVMVGGVELGKPADQMGLKAGDILVKMNDVAIANDSDVIKIVQANVGKQIQVTWKRNDELMSGVTIPAENGRIGIRLGNYYIGPKKVLKYSIAEALVAGVNNVVQSTAMFFASIGQIIAGKSSIKDNFGGPIAIAKLATQSAENGLTSFLGFMALLSMSLAILNILPFPALDGGHLMMLVYEKLSGKEIPTKVKLAIQRAGFILLLVFMVFVIYNDITRF